MLLMVKTGGRSLSVISYKKNPKTREQALMGCGWGKKRKVMVRL